VKALVLVKVADGRSPAELKPHALAENQAIWRLYLEGTVRDMHLRGDMVGAAFTLEVADTDEARRIVGALPMVEAGLLAAEIIPLGPFRPLENLFAAPQQG
jgi:hypothetical protein